MGDDEGRAEGSHASEGHCVSRRLSACATMCSAGTYLKPSQAGDVTALATLTPARARAYGEPWVVLDRTRAPVFFLSYTEQSRHSPLNSACAVRVPLVLLIAGILPWERTWYARLPSRYTVIPLHPSV